MVLLKDHTHEIDALIERLRQDMGFGPARGQFDENDLKELGLDESHRCLLFGQSDGRVLMATGAGNFNTGYVYGEKRVEDVLQTGGFLWAYCKAHPTHDMVQGIKNIFDDDNVGLDDFLGTLEYFQNTFPQVLGEDKFQYDKHVKTLHAMNVVQQEAVLVFSLCLTKQMIEGCVLKDNVRRQLLYSGALKNIEDDTYLLYDDKLFSFQEREKFLTRNILCSSLTVFNIISYDKADKKVIYNIMDFMRGKDYPKKGLSDETACFVAYNSLRELLYIKPNDTPYANIIKQHNPKAFQKAMEKAVVDLWIDDNARVVHFIATLDTLLEKEEDQKFLKELAGLFFQKMTPEQKQLFVDGRGKDEAFGRHLRRVALSQDLHGSQGFTQWRPKKM